MNFIITTGMYLPVRVCGSLEHVQYVDYLSDAARVMPSDFRSAMTQRTAFQSACRCTDLILRKKLFPSHVQKGGKAIHRYGFTGQVAGLTVRPVFLRMRQTLEAVFEYIRLSPNKKKMRQNVDKIFFFLMSRFAVLWSHHLTNVAGTTR